MDQQPNEKSSTSVEAFKALHTNSNTTSDDDEPMRRDVEQALETLGATMERVPTYLQPRMPFQERLHHFTFAWYTVS